ncbi:MULTISPECIES: DivIVA domain-containing protein [unclassified Corynebacterium]|uniref:DivIVA domain-containing protein n=1 Tax=unclassified Corynebacterium TaxID=2624378 RepID=UPI0029CA09DF|nr:MULTISPECIES: DivIVA domain-containing protein [unclassified Corynebacterium]WPF66966.1 DivIVA domain-containing protein [Corynebacterium sp. 22KM0430]WPF69454.1 DivIVA domain-containing protein [Corynebacterium sp. 21KM1197]
MMFLMWILLILVLGALTVVGTWAWGRIFGRGEVDAPVLDQARVREHNQEALDRGDLDDVRFDLVIRGYRPDQVDAVVEALWQRIKALEEQAAQREQVKSD